MEDNLREQLKVIEELATNFSTFVNDLYKELPERQQRIIDKELKIKDIGDMSKTAAKIVDEIKASRNKFDL